MGNSNSVELECPLQVPSGPMQALDDSIIAQFPTSVCVKASTIQARASVIDQTTGKTISIFRSKAFSSRTELAAPNGHIIASVKKNTFSRKYRVFQGGQTEQLSFLINDISGMFNTMLLVAEFTDRTSGIPCRIVTKGKPSSKVVLCYLERGSPTLTQLEGIEDHLQNQARYRRVGRIRRRPHFTGEGYFIEATAGVDLTLLLLIWHVRHACLLAERASISS
ncbi:unnamed protein product [Phytophthora fragariaefolia]|uniref:Unnamed protein product n=1 Tax=Phytophthora fragariaefolia TaxID=1490495 RepID=A0A9W7CUX5_9STRA|nr:unnamed protein product [Phytophthora fragariaefolia]